MAIVFLPILKALGPLIASAGAAVANFSNMRKSGASVKSEEHIRAIEEEVARLAKISLQLAEQLQAVAEELKAQAAVNDAQEKKLKICMIVSITSVCIGIGGIAIALIK